MITFAPPTRPRPNFARLAMRSFRFATVVAVLSLPAVLAQPGLAQDGKPSAEDARRIEQAMKIRPEPRNDVDYEYPLAANANVPSDLVQKLQIVPSRDRFGAGGWIVSDDTGRIIRVFLDRVQDHSDKTKAGSLDQWSYYKDGIEIYREVDTDKNQKPNEYRWLGPGGSRWGIDVNQDGEIDQWKAISAEEVAFEVFQAIKKRDSKRFNRLLINGDELKSLNLEGEFGNDIVKKVNEAKQGFADLVRSQKYISANSDWIHSGNGMPSMAAADKEGLGKDLLCYDHATSVYRTGDKIGTLALGSIVRIGNVWRLIELPQFVEEGKAIVNGGVFFPIQQMQPTFGDGEGMMDAQTEKLAELYKKLEDDEEAIGDAKGKGSAMAEAQKARANTLVKLYQNSTPKEQLDWLQNVADTVSDAYIQGMFPDGVEFLNAFSNLLSRTKSKEGIDYVEYRVLTAEYSLALNEQDNRGREKATEKFHDDLERFVNKFPNSKFAPRALWDLGQSEDVNGNEAGAVSWYEKLAKAYPKSDYGQRGLGAIRRIRGVGQKIPFSGAIYRGGKFDIADARNRGKIVVVHYWETWCADDVINQEGDTSFDELQRLNAKWKSDDVIIVGANVEVTTEAFEKYMSSNKKIQWPQMHAPGGMESSPLAIQIGLVSEPMILVFDTDGKLVDTKSAVADLETGHPTYSQRG